LFANRWNGPFKVKKQLDKGSYVLEEMDGTELKRNYAESHIKRFFPRGHNLEDIRKGELKPGEERNSEQMEQSEEEEDNNSLQPEKSEVEDNTAMDLSE
jgi:hypothetical protein